MRNLILGELRFSELAALLPSATPNMLSKRLKEMVAASIIEKAWRGYALTPKGRELEPVIKAVAHWGERHGMASIKPTDFRSPRFMLTSIWRSGRRTTRESVTQIELIGVPALVHSGPQFKMVAGEGAHDLLVELSFEQAIGIFKRGMSLREAGVVLPAGSALEVFVETFDLVS